MDGSLWRGNSPTEGAPRRKSGRNIGITAGTEMRVVALTLALLLSLPALAVDVTGIPRIVDGDTVAIGQTKIRLEGIDAPETDQLCLPLKAAVGLAELRRAINWRSVPGESRGSATF